MAYSSVDSTRGGWHQIALDTDSFIGRVQYCSADTILAGGQIQLRSTDGGLTWHQWSTPTGIGGPYFMDCRNGYIQAYLDTLFKTTDGGITWDTLHSRVPSFTSSFSILTPSTLIASSLSWISRSTDSGRTWKVDQLSSPKLNAVSFSNPKYGYAVGDFQDGPKPGMQGAGAFRTIDGGETWSQLFTNYPGDLRTCLAVDNNTLYAAGSKGIVVTRDAGESWRILDPNPDLLKMAFPSPKHGIAVGGGGLVMATYDGNSWVQQETPTEAGLYGVAFYNDTIGAISGENGTLLLTHTGGLAGVTDYGSKDTTQLAVYPNPATSQTTLSCTLPANETVTISIVSAAGQLLQIVNERTLSSGSLMVNLSLTRLTAGSYYLVLNTPTHHGVANLSVN